MKSEAPLDWCVFSCNNRLISDNPFAYTFDITDPFLGIINLLFT